ncbi:MAG: cbb3-type cytochrome c oxidase subunit I [Thermoplasmata archaeon]|jgi:cytochrome c oxidase subunit 1
MVGAGALTKLRDGLRNLPRADRHLIGAFFALAIVTLAMGGLFALILALEVGNLIQLPPLPAFQYLTLHASTIFYYWLYFVQTGVILALILVYTKGAHLTPAWRGIAWAGFFLMVAGLAVNLVTVAQGAAVLYTVFQPLAQQFEGSGFFLIGYILLAIGLFLAGLTGFVTSIRPRLEGVIGEWSSISYAAVLWMSFLMVASVISLLAYVPAALLAFGMSPLIADFNYTMSWAVLFHNMHYLPLMSTVLVWYVLAEATTGVKSVFSRRLSKSVFFLYLLVVPPTSLYHVFLEPDVASGVKLMGSVLALLISVPTIAVFLIIVASLQASANGQGARGLFGWLRYLPWRNPAFSAMALAWVAALGGGVVANVLILERVAPLLSDTFAIPGYFHFLTIAVTLTFIGALIYMIPALTGHRLWMPSLARALPFVLIAGVTLFAVAGTWAGFLGVPRRTLEFDYGGAAPSSWAPLMTAVGIGGVIMVAAGVVYVSILAITALRDMRSGLRVEDWPVASFRVEDSVGQSAWFGPAAVAVLVAGMYVVTILAFRLMRSLPFAG